jgi:tetratricopeptide (TPR) repeat protein
MIDSTHLQAGSSSEPDRPASYLAGVTPEQARQLAAANRTGLTALRSHLDAGEAVAFLGAGSSAPLYPLWAGVIAELIDSAVDQGLPEDAAATCRALAGERPDSVVEVLRGHLGVPQYQAALRMVFRVRRDPESGRTWTPTQELICRCPFKAVVTTNYDPGIVDARMRVRPNAVGTGFSSWTDELELDRWRTGEVFGDQELPVLFAHGRHNQPEAIVLATTEYRRAYAGKLARVLAQMADAWHLVWVGFSFADQRINSVLREVAEHTGTRAEPGGPPRHVAIMAWDPARGDDPPTLRRLARIEYGANLILYPAPGGDHSALQRLLADFVSDYPPAPAAPPPSPATRVASDRSPDALATASLGISTAAAISPPAIPVRWEPPVEIVDPFMGRVEELARLDRWAADPTVRLVGVTAWGGAGKTALVTHWLDRHGGAAGRPRLQGVFGWSFYADPSAEGWATALLEWAAAELEVRLEGRARRAAAVLALLETVPLVLVLDGLEVTQEGPEGAQFGRLLDGTLREVLTGACQLDHGGLVVLTSRFAFADLEGYDGGPARMLDVPPFTPAEGAVLLAATGAGWLDERKRRDLVEGVDGHALAVGALGGLLADRPLAEDLKKLQGELARAATTNTRVAKVLRFYADRLSEADRYLVAAVGLFAHPVTPDALLTIARHRSFRGRLDAWTPQQVKAAAHARLAGLLSWHPDGTLSAHPLVRESFRPLAMGAAEVAADATLSGVPERIASREDGLRVVEAIELLLDADQWQAADGLYRGRTAAGKLWRRLPAVRLGQQAASAFVATAARRQACADQLTSPRLSFYLNAVGLYGTHAGDLETALEYLEAGAQHDRDVFDWENLAIALRNLAQCLGGLGKIDAARRAAAEAATSGNTYGSMRNSMGFQGWVAMLAGDSRAAEAHFLAADRINYADPKRNHISSQAGCWWGEFLARTGRPGPARRLTDRNREISTEHGWNENIARCDRLLARLDLGADDHTTAKFRATAAAATFRDGDYLLELAETLPVLAETARAAGDLDDATRQVAETLSITRPRSLLLAHAAALAVRAHICADQVAAGNRTRLDQGRDTADAALRIATRRGLAWHELEALDAHAHLDQAEGVDHGWVRRAAALRARLIPADLNPDPLATVERQVAEEQARGQDDNK